jgi:hypothetical protein
MKLILLTSLIATATFAGDFDRVIFSDDFSSNAFGPRWGHYKSISVVKDGVLVGTTAETSDHAAVDHIVIPGERDLEVSVKFRFTSDKAKGFNVWFDDKKYKGSHAGHICSVVINLNNVVVSDAKTGNFENAIYAKKKTLEGLSADEKKMLTTKSKSFPNKVSLNEWHTLVTSTKGDEVSVSIDGKKIGSFKSEGIAHDTKSLISLTTNRIDVEYDDFSIKGVAK